MEATGCGPEPRSGKGAWQLTTTIKRKVFLVSRMVMLHWFTLRKREQSMTMFFSPYSHFVQNAIGYFGSYKTSGQSWPYMVSKTKCSPPSTLAYAAITKIEAQTNSVLFFPLGSHGTSVYNSEVSFIFARLIIYVSISWKRKSRNV